MQGRIEDDTLCLEQDDYVPITKGWGLCLLGFMAGKFPGRDAVEKLMKSWPWPTRIAFHPDGWMVFRFETADDIECARTEGNLTIFGTPLMLCSMLEDFNFKEVPQFKFDGPRIHVIVDAKNPPQNLIEIKLPSGKVFNQKIKFDFYPLYCLKCKMMGHIASYCRTSRDANPIPRAFSRGGLPVGGNKKEDWQVVRGQRNNNINAGTERRDGANGRRSKSCHQPRTANERSRSRPHQPHQHQNPLRPKVTRKGSIPVEKNNTHIYIPSPLAGMSGKAVHVENNTMNEELANSNHIKGGSDNIYTIQNEREESMHLNIPSRVSEFDFDDPQGKKRPDRNDPTKVASVVDEIEDPTSPVPSLREEELAPQNQCGNETIPPSNDEAISADSSNLTSNSPSSSEWDPKKDPESKAPNKAAQNLKKNSPKKARGGSVAKKTYHHK